MIANYQRKLKVFGYLRWIRSVICGKFVRSFEANSFGYLWQIHSVIWGEFIRWIMETGCPKCVSCLKQCVFILKQLVFRLIRVRIQLITAKFSREFLPNTADTETRHQGSMASWWCCCCGIMTVDSVGSKGVPAKASSLLCQFRRTVRQTAQRTVNIRIISSIRLIMRCKDTNNYKL